MDKTIAIVHVKTRNEAITIGALAIKKELEGDGFKVEYCTYETAHNYKVVLVSMTSTWDLYEFYKSMKEHKWENRKFLSMIGGFGCQNPFALQKFIDYAFFGRAENIISEVCLKLLNREDIEYDFITELKKTKKVFSRPVQKLYDFELKYGKNNATWREEFTGCPFKCKFCHYTWNRENIRKGDTHKYINDGISSGSPEIMIKDVLENTEKLGRFTTAIDGYSERLRFLFGKPITWDMVEEAFDHTASFLGNSFIKLYNISNFPTETEHDEQEFIEFCKLYVQNTAKKDGILKIEVFNTAFRPSINTPMERMPVRLFPEARRVNLEIASGSGIVIKYTHLIQGAYMHLLDIIAIRYSEKDYDLIDFIATDKDFNKKNNQQKFDILLKRIDINDFVREYSLSEPFISDIVSCSKSEHIKRAAMALAKQINKKPHV